MLKAVSINLSIGTNIPMEYHLSNVLLYIKIASYKQHLFSRLGHTCILHTNTYYTYTCICNHNETKQVFTMNL